jgi:hypothetical protein
MMEYTTPELRNLGSLATLTLGFQGSTPDFNGRAVTLDSGPIQLPLNG